MKSLKSKIYWKNIKNAKLRKKQLEIKNRKK